MTIKKRKYVVQKPQHIRSIKKRIQRKIITKIETTFLKKKIT